MLRFIEQFNDAPVVNLRSANELARITDIVIDPNKLKLEAFVVYVRRDAEERALFTSDIREIAHIGLIIDSEENLHEMDEELVRLQELLDINFRLESKKVYTQGKKYLGRVTNFAVNDKTFRITKLYVTPPKRKVLQINDLIIDRSMVVEVTDKEIIVKDTAIKDAKPSRGFFGAPAS